jgi:hypothetical protein
LSSKWEKPDHTFRHAIMSRESIDQEEDSSTGAEEALGTRPAKKNA